MKRRRHVRLRLGLCLLSVVAATLSLVVVALTPRTIMPRTIMPKTGSEHYDVRVSVDLASSLGTSHFSPGMSYVDNSLDYPTPSNSAAIERVEQLLQGGVTFQNTPIMGWGLPDPWPDPSTPEPTDWTMLDARLQLIVSTGGIPVITLCEAPWWMKGQLQADGSTRVLTQADEWSDRAFASRVLDDEMDEWLHLVQRVAERYMVAPYNVRYFQVWNELKGYYDPGTNAYDYQINAGNPDEPSAHHGYTFMYNRVYDRLMTVADSLGIPQGDVMVGGPYPVIDTWSSTAQSHPSTITTAYGTFDQRPLDVVMYWLKHKAGAGFISVDAAATNKDSIEIANASVAAEKFADIVRWIRSLDPSVYPGATTLPIWLAEWYARPYTDWADNDHSNAIKTYAMMEFLKAGGAVALAWGGADDDSSGPRLWTQIQKTGPGGGTPLPFYASYRDFKAYFGPGTPLYQTTIAPAGLIDAVASSSMVMLVNKTPNPLVVSLDGTMVSLAPYHVTITGIS